MLVPVPSSLDRRGFLAAGLTTAGALAVPGPLLTAHARRRPPLARDVAFSQGVASGQPAPRAVTLWTRVDGLERPARLVLEVARDPGFRRVVHRRSVTARPSSGFAVHARVAEGLRPGERYWYRFAGADADSAVGRFRTARPADSREPVRIGFFSCQDYESGHYTAHRGLAAEEDLDLVVCLGDYIYEKSFDPNKVRTDTLGANSDGEVQTLAEYRAKYALYHSDPALRAMRRAHPMLAIWDDHEVEDNYAADRPGDKTDDRRGVEFEQRRRNGYRAFFEAMPRVRLRRDPDRIYGRVGFGRTLDLFLLDQRQYRSDQPCGDQMGTGATCAEAEDPSRTLLGAAQKAWFKRGLERSQATWKVVGSQVMVMALDLPAGNALNPDQWDGYRAERRELLGHIADRGIQDVAFITGDIHVFFAGDVAVDGRQRAPGSPRAVATEFVGGSITSEAIADRYLGEEGRPIIQPGDAAVLQTTNPHLRYADESARGYGVLEARADELLVQFKGPDTVRSPRALNRTIARFRVRRGEARVERI